jgi:hypothetical protein
MKKTIWMPVLISVIFGVLAGISLSAKLAIITSSGWVISFFGMLFALAAAFGGPLAGFLTPFITFGICALFGYPELKALASDPLNFWTNIIVIGVAVAAQGFFYRLAYTHVKMPLRLVPWIGIVAFLYFFGTPLLVIVQFSLGMDYGTPSLWEAITTSVQGYLPQMLFDIVFTCLIWIALPKQYHRPLWYEAPAKPVEKNAQA